jgi:hypothetical protein
MDGEQERTVDLRGDPLPGYEEAEEAGGEEDEE